MIDTPQSFKLYTRANQANDVKNAWQWWAGRRRLYNFGLVIAGILAFVCYATVLFRFESRIRGADFDGITTLAQGIAYLVMMGVANICFFIGPISELIVRPNDIPRYRSVTFAFGFWFSVLLPFIIPVMLLTLVITQPPWWFGTVE